MCRRACCRNSSSATRGSPARLLEPAGGQIRRTYLVLVGQSLEQLPDGLIEHGMLQFGGEIGEGAKHESALVHQEMRDVQVVVAADHAVVVEEDVDVERPWLVALVLEPARAARAAHRALEVLHALQQRRRL